jgi:hypothetical protein
MTEDLTVHAWVLIDCSPSVISEAQLPRWNIESEAQLRELLGRFKDEKPRIFRLMGPREETLIMGIGGGLAGLRWTKPPMNEHLKMAVNPCPLTDQGCDFREQGTDTGFRPKYLFRPAEVIDAAIHFFTTGDLAQWMHWLTIPAGQISPQQ